MRFSGVSASSQCPHTTSPPARFNTPIAIVSPIVVREPSPFLVNLGEKAQETGATFVSTIAMKRDLTFCGAAVFRTHPTLVTGRYHLMDPRNWITRLYLSLQREEGQTMAEYGVVLALITLAVVATLFLLGGAINDKLDAVYKTLIK